MGRCQECTKGHFCLKALLHEGSLLHEYTFARVETFFLTFTVAPNPYSWPVFFLTIFTPNPYPWSVFDLLYLYYIYIYICFFLNIITVASLTLFLVDNFIINFFIYSYLFYFVQNCHSCKSDSSCKIVFMQKILRAKVSSCIVYHNSFKMLYFLTSKTY